MEKVINDYEIKEIALNPAYMTNDDLGSLINQGFQRLKITVKPRFIRL